MQMNQQDPGLEESGGYLPPSPGVQLRALREAAQLTVDDVALHLKLARRQVIAIENDDHEALPGPTFVRGFIRNYARLLRVDAQPLLEAGNLAVPPVDPIQPIARTVGELPLDSGAGVSWTRWLIPVGLILVLVGGIAVYEMSDVSSPMRRVRKDSGEATVAPPAVPSAAEPGAAATDSSAQPAGAPAAPGQTNLPSPSPQPGTPTMPAPSPAATVPDAAVAAPRSAGAPATGEQGRLDFELAGPSWIEVRDARGELLLSRNLSAQSSQTLTGTLPLTMRIGNARAVQLRFNGAQVDLRPHTQREIARLTLPLASR
ncbi:MAG: RodZ domain-containing protein [Betaproteobacteria bacterium]